MIRPVDVAVHRALAGRELDAGGASVRRGGFIAAAAERGARHREGGQQPAGIPARNPSRGVQSRDIEYRESTQVPDMETSFRANRLRRG